MKTKAMTILMMLVFLGLGSLWAEGTVANSYITTTVSDDYKITLTTVGGNPNITTDNNVDILSDENTLAIVRVEERLTPDQEESGVSYTVGDGGQSISAPAVADANNIVGVWLQDEEIGSDTTARPINIWVHQKVTVMRDAIRVEYEIVNKDWASHNLGFMQVLNVTTPSTVSFRVPQIGEVTRETTLQGVQIPSYIQVSDNFRQPTLLARATIGQWDATPPTTVLICNADALSDADDMWTYEPRGADVRSSAALVLKWSPRWVQPGGKIRFVFYYGVDWSTNDYTPPAGTAIFAPSFLTPTQTPMPFTLTSYLYSVAAFPIQGAKAYLTLPPGLTLAQGESLTKDFPTIPPRPSATAPDPEAKVSWQILPPTEPMGRLPITVKVVIPDIGTKILTCYLDTSTGFKRAVPKGISMLSIPFNLEDQRTNIVLQDLGDLNRRVARWSPGENRYLYFPDDPYMSQVRVGQSFWVKIDNGATLDVSKGQSKEPTPVPWWQDFSLELGKGWNQIANPFVYPTTWGRVRVAYLGQIKEWGEAVSANWIREFIFYWNPEKGAYEWSNKASYILSPWEGYFVRALVPCRLIFSPLDIPQPTGTTSSIVQTKSLPDKGWVLKLGLITKGVVDDDNYIGVGEARIVEKPPSPLPTYIRLRKGEEGLAMDIRGVGDKKEWIVEVNAPEGGKLVWEGMEKLPRSIRLYIVDESGKRTFMGATASYDVVGKRTLKIEAVEGRGKAMILGLRVVPQRGGASIAFTLSESALVSVKVSTPSGITVRNLAPRSLSAGANAISWDGRDEKGRMLPAGIYLVEVVARGDSSEVARAFQMVSLR